MEEKPEIEVRPALEIQAAHDRLLAIIHGEVPSPFQNRHAMTALMEAASVLCWVLKHEHNQTFGDNLVRIDEYLRACGFELRDSGRLEPFSPRPTDEH